MRKKKVGLIISALCLVFMCSINVLAINVSLDGSKNIVYATATATTGKSNTVYATISNSSGKILAEKRQQEKSSISCLTINSPYRARAEVKSGSLIATAVKIY